MLNYRWDEQSNSADEVAVLPFESGDMTKSFNVPHSAWGSLRWTPDGNALTYVITGGGVSNLWNQPVAGGAPKQLTDFKADQIFSFDWSRDGKQLVASRGVETNDVVLISNFR